MTELPKIFENAKVGDDVLCPRRGWLKIRKIDELSNYPINTGCSSYMINGLYLKSDAAPTLWPADKVPQYFLDLLPRPKKKVKKTIERWLLLNADGLSDGLVYFESPLSHKYFNTPVRVTGEYEGEE